MQQVSRQTTRQPRTEAWWCDLPGWRDGVSGAAIKVLDADNHLYLAGAGPSTVADYRTPGHVEPDAISAIVDWLP